MKKSHVLRHGAFFCRKYFYVVGGILFFIALLLFVKLQIVSGPTGGDTSVLAASTESPDFWYYFFKRIQDALKNNPSLQGVTPTPSQCPSLDAVHGVSPLLFGTNTSQLVPGRYFVQSAKVWDILQQIHVRFVRIGFENGPVTDTEKLILQRIKDNCMTPLVTFPLHESVSHAKDIVAAVNSVFGSDTVYFEFSNEPDLKKYSYATQEEYVALWNAFVPSIKKVAPNAKFGGPTVSRPIPGYIGYFVAHANPKPDFVSWHKYYCTKSMATNDCKNDIIRTMGKDTADIRSAITNSKKSVPPFIISEWNFGQNSDPDRTSDFKTQFITTVFSEMIKNKIFAANQFEATDFHSPWLLVSNDMPTIEAQAFKKMYESIFK